MVGQQLLHYQIDAHLGTGGMGEVYRARDTKLGRSVAIKVLPEIFAQDAERVSRFEREARLLASLNHPHIAALHGLESSDGRQLLIMELVEGETLAQRIGRGPVPVEDALIYARQIAEALEAAHEKGVIHRDLKPGNVKITPEGKVKVLDFGLAKAVEEGAQANVMNSPTLSIAATQAGLILGTAAYMAPEQAKGFAVDHRSDIFSFGCVLYEMLTGRQTFQGDSMTEVIASVIKSDADLALLPPNLHPGVAGLLRRCLAKDPKRRWHAVADVRVEIEALLSDPRGLTVRAAAADRPLWRRAIPAAAIALVAAALSGAAAWTLRPMPATSITRFSIVIPDGQGLTRTGRHNLAISPDGQSIVYVADNQLYLRGMGDIEPRPIQGTDQDITTPFFSPDGRWIGFYSVPESMLKKVAISGGASVTIGQVTNPFGASWGGGDRILVGQGAGGIVRVSANGGKPEVIVKVESGEVAHGPEMLPDGEHVLFTLTKIGGDTRWDEAQVVVQSLQSGERTVLFEGGSDARYVPTGHILYALGSDVFAVPFDAGTRTVLGGPVPIVEQVMRSAPINTAAMFFSVSATGTLAYFFGDELSPRLRSLAVIDRKGTATTLPLAPAQYADPRVSPDGKQLLARVDADGEPNVWVFDLLGKVEPRKLTFGGVNYSPSWSPDGRRVLFVSTREENRPAIFWQPSDGTGVAERLTGPDVEPGFDPVLSPDSSVLLFRDNRDAEGDISMMPLTGDRKAVPLIGGPAAQWNPNLSLPDGRWIAYASAESGMPQIYVQPFPPTGAKYQLPTGFARAPLWAPDGRRLYYLEELPNNIGRLMAVDVTTSSGFAYGKPMPVFEGIDRSNSRWPYTVAPDGRLIVVVRNPENGGDSRNAEIRVTLNWFEELKQRVPVN